MRASGSSSDAVAPTAVEARWTTSVAIVTPMITSHQRYCVANQSATSCDLSPSSAMKIRPKDNKKADTQIPFDVPARDALFGRHTEVRVQAESLVHPSL